MYHIVNQGNLELVVKGDIITGRCRGLSASYVAPYIDIAIEEHDKVPMTVRLSSLEAIEFAGLINKMALRLREKEGA